MARPKKREPYDVRGICVECNIRQQVRRNSKVYRSVCASCHSKSYSIPPAQRKRPYIIHKEDKCIKCGFIPIHPCQLDVDHKDGNHSNNDPTNLQTLCANCHRLKTHYDREGLPLFYF